MRILAEKIVDLTMKIDTSTFLKLFETRDAAIENTLKQLKDKEVRKQFYDFCDWSIGDARATIKEAEEVQKRLVKLMEIMKDENIPQREVL